MHAIRQISEHIWLKILFFLSHPDVLPSIKYKDKKISTSKYIIYYVRGYMFRPL